MNFAFTTESYEFYLCYPIKELFCEDAQVIAQIRCEVSSAAGGGALRLGNRLAIANGVGISKVVGDL